MLKSLAAHAHAAAGTSRQYAEGAYVHVQTVEQPGHRNALHVERQVRGDWSLTSVGLDAAGHVTLAYLQVEIVQHEQPVIDGELGRKAVEGDFSGLYPARMQVEVEVELAPARWVDPLVGQNRGLGRDLLGLVLLRGRCGLARSGSRRGSNQSTQIVGIQHLRAHGAGQFGPLALVAEDEVGRHVEVADVTIEVRHVHFAAVRGDGPRQPIWWKLQLRQLKQSQDGGGVSTLGADLGREVPFRERQSHRAVDLHLVLAELGVDRERVLATILRERADRPAERGNGEGTVAGARIGHEFQRFAPVRIERHLQLGRGHAALDLRQLQAVDRASELEPATGQDVQRRGATQRAGDVTIQTPGHAIHPRRSRQVDAIGIQVEVRGEVPIERTGRHSAFKGTLRQLHLQGFQT